MNVSPPLYPKSLNKYINKSLVCMNLISTHDKIKSVSKLSHHGRVRGILSQCA